MNFVSVGTMVVRVGVGGVITATASRKHCRSCKQCKIFDIHSFDNLSLI
jgi:hypothetical protein